MSALAAPLHLAEAAEYCGLTRDSFKKKVVRDRLRKVRLDKCWRFDIADLDEWIDSPSLENTPRKSEMLNALAFRASEEVRAREH
jgi:excisionase family DNA binding protein